MNEHPIKGLADMLTMSRPPDDPAHDVGTVLQSLVMAAGTLAEWYAKSPVRRHLIIDNINSVGDAKWALEYIWTETMPRKGE